MIRLYMFSTHFILLEKSVRASITKDMEVKCHIVTGDKAKT